MGKMLFILLADWRGVELRMASIIRVWLDMPNCRVDVRGTASTGEESHSFCCMAAPSTRASSTRTSVPLPSASV
jgi:hypothetical protein